MYRKYRVGVGIMCMCCSGLSIHTNFLDELFCSNTNLITSKLMKLIEFKYFSDDNLVNFRSCFIQKYIMYLMVLLNEFRYVSLRRNF